MHGLPSVPGLVVFPQESWKPPVALRERPACPGWGVGCRSNGLPGPAGGLAGGFLGLSVRSLPTPAGAASGAPPRLGNPWSDRAGVPSPGRAVGSSADTAHFRISLSVCTKRQGKVRFSKIPRGVETAVLEGVLAQQRVSVLGSRALCLDLSVLGHLSAS